MLDKKEKNQKKISKKFTFRGGGVKANLEKVYIYFFRPFPYRVSFKVEILLKCRDMIQSGLYCEDILLKVALCFGRNTVAWPEVFFSLMQPFSFFLTLLQPSSAFCRLLQPSAALYRRLHPDAAFSILV